MYIVYIRDRYYFSLVCTFRKAINFFEVKVDVQKGSLRFREKHLTIDVLFSSNYVFIHCCHVIIVLND